MQERRRLSLVLPALTALYFLAGKLGLGFASVNASASPVWAPTGIALAAFLVLGLRVWPAILLGAFLVNVTTAGSVATSAAIAVGNLLEGLCGAALVRRFAEGRAAFDRPRTIILFTLLAAGFATTVSASVGVTSLALQGFVRWDDYTAIWSTWWLGDAMGALVVTPAAVLWSTATAPRWSRRQILEAGLLLGGFFVVCVVVFGELLPAWRSRAVLCLPFLMWAAFRFSRREVSALTLLLSVVAIWATVSGAGPFVGPSPNSSLLQAQTLMGLLSVTTLATAAVVDRRDQMERAFRVSQENLERRVAERTESLSRAVEALQREVAERQRVESNLRESELRLRGLLEAAPDAMVIVDRRGRITQVSAQCVALFGFSRDEMVGRPVELLLPERFRGRHASHREVFSADPRARPMGAGLQLHATRCDGTEFPVEISLSPVAGGEHEPLVMAAIRDISERRRVEEHVRRLNLDLERRVQERTAELERSNQALQQFAYAASHDLQEPLRTVSNYVQMLARRCAGRLDAEAEELIGFVVDGAQWMHLLLRDLLAYSRLDTHSAPSDSTDLDAALGHALDNLQAIIGEKGARIARNGALPRVRADELHMVQLFQNLVGNAIKFNRPGVAPQVRIEAEPHDSEWIFRVRDNGIGIERRHAERIFGLFQRLHRREEYPGTGMGLAICRKVVERHGGRIWVESEPGAGSTFSFTLPRQEPVAT